MQSKPILVLSRRLRKTPFEDRVFEQGASAFTVYNHMPLASYYGSPLDNYHHLRQHVQIWDVSCERQVEVRGPDALKLCEYICPRDISNCGVGQSMYIPLTDEKGGVVNDPILLCLEKDRYWLSIADSGVMLWLKGIAVGKGYDVEVFEPDVSPLAIQGPKSFDLIADLFGEQIRKISYFGFVETEIVGTPVILCRSGWSGQGGFEIFLQDSKKGLELWDAVWEAGQQYHIQAGCPNLIERIEAGLYSYGSDMTLENNPLECGFDRFLDLDKPAEYMARDALKEIQKKGPKHQLIHLIIHGNPLVSPRHTWEVVNDKGEQIGIVTSLAYSPFYEANLSFATISTDYSIVGSSVKVQVSDSELREATVASRKWSIEK